MRSAKVMNAGTDNIRSTLSPWFLSAMRTRTKLCPRSSNVSAEMRPAGLMCEWDMADSIGRGSATYSLSSNSPQTASGRQASRSAQTTLAGTILCAPHVQRIRRRFVVEYRWSSVRVLTHWAISCRHDPQAMFSWCSLPRKTGNTLLWSQDTVTFVWLGHVEVDVRSHSVILDLCEQDAPHCPARKQYNAQGVGSAGRNRRVGVAPTIHQPYR